MKNETDEVNQNAETDQYSKDSCGIVLGQNIEHQPECFLRAFSEYFHSLVQASIPESESNIGEVFGFDFKAKAVDAFLNDSIQTEVQHIIEGDQGCPKSYHSRFYLSHYGNCSTAYMCKLKHELTKGLVDKKSKNKAIYLDVDNGEGEDSTWGKFITTCETILEKPESSQEEIKQFCLQNCPQDWLNRKRTYFIKDINRIIVLIDHMDRVFVDWFCSSRDIKRTQREDEKIAKYINNDFVKKITLREVNLLRTYWYRAFHSLCSAESGDVKYLFVSTALTELEYAFGYYQHDDLMNQRERRSTAAEWQNIENIKLVQGSKALVLRLPNGNERPYSCNRGEVPATCPFVVDKDNNLNTGKLFSTLKNFCETCEHNIWLFCASFRHAGSDDNAEFSCNGKMEEQWREWIKSYYRHTNSNRRDRSLLHDQLWSFCLYAAEALGEKATQIEKMQADSWIKKARKAVMKWNNNRLWKSVEKQWGEISEAFEKRTVDLLKYLSAKPEPTTMSEQEVFEYMKRGLPRMGKKLIEIKLNTKGVFDEKDEKTWEYCAVRVLVGRRILSKGDGKCTLRPFMHFLYE